MTNEPIYIDPVHGGVSISEDERAMLISNMTHNNSFTPLYEEDSIRITL